MSDDHPAGKPGPAWPGTAESAGVADPVGRPDGIDRQDQNSASVRSCRVTIVLVVPVFWAQTL